MNLYEINKNLVEQYETMTEQQLKNDIKMLRTWLTSKNNKYFMLMCKEASYYTVFTYKNDKKIKSMAEEIIDVARHQGEIKCIDFKDNHIEIWISTNKESFVYMFFEYDNGVIEI